jgi:endo-1,4-beta-mannosidase
MRGMREENSVTRRGFMGAAALAAVAVGSRAAQGQAAEPKPAEDYSRVRGFNYQPSYGSHGIEIWGEPFNIDLIREELLQGKKYFPGMNTIRLWLSYDAYIRQPDKMPERFRKVIDLGEELKLRFIPTLFNGWHSCPDFGGISVEMISAWGNPGHFGDSFVPYLDAVVKPFANDARILLWDLCNEPFNSVACEPSQKTVLDWLGRVRGHLKEVGVAAPLGVGCVPAIDAMRTIEPLSDVITFHPYYAWNLWIKTPEQFAAFVDEAVAFGKSVGKPMLATETGWGALDDQKRAEVLAVELGTLAKRGLGFTAHLLHHTLVADGHRPEYGPISDAGYMAFIEKDGSLRPHHEVFNSF